MLGIQKLQSQGLYQQKGANSKAKSNQPSFGIKVNYIGPENTDEFTRTFLQKQEEAFNPFLTAVTKKLEKFKIDHLDMYLDNNKAAGGRLVLDHPPIDNPLVNDLTEETAEHGSVMLEKLDSTGAIERNLSIMESFITKRFGWIVSDMPIRRTPKPQKDMSVGHIAE